MTRRAIAATRRVRRQVYLLRSRHIWCACFLLYIAVSLLLAFLARTSNEFCPSVRIGRFDRSKSMIITPDNFLWSKNWRAWADTHLPPSYYKAHTSSYVETFHLQDFQDSNVVWLRTGSSNDPKEIDVYTFAKQILPYLTKPFVLITTDGDQNVPSEVDLYQQILDSPSVVAWYTQNFDGTVQHSKLRPVPVGFDMHTPRAGYWSDDLSENLRIMLELRKVGLKQQNARRRLPLVPPWDDNTHASRKLATKALECVPHHVEPRMPVGELFVTFTKYKFGLAPRGNGIDTHRIWEMLFFGVVPITQTSPLDALFTELPVIIVNEYQELCRDGFLEEQWEGIQHLWPAPDEVFTTDYWIQRHVQKTKHGIELILSESQAIS